MVIEHQLHVDHDPTDNRLHDSTFSNVDLSFLSNLLSLKALQDCGALASVKYILAFN